MASKKIPELEAAPSFSGNDLLIIEKADNSGTYKLTYNQLIDAISAKVLNKTFTSGALANYLVNDATATEAGQRALDAKMGKTLNDAISTLNSRLANTTNIPTDADLNDYTNNGVTLYSAGYSVNRLNAHSDWVGGVFVTIGGGGFYWQICSNYATASKVLYFRKKYGSAWSAWYTIALA